MLEMNVFMTVVGFVRDGMNKNLNIKMKALEKLLKNLLLLDLISKIIILIIMEN
jgi:hypothetical protein